MYGYIYETINLINGKKYIGQHHSKIFDTNYYGSGSYISKDLSSLGKENFKVTLLEECNSQEELDEKERLYIKNLRENYPIELIYNIANGGQTGWIYGCKHSELTKKRIGLASKNRSKESNEKISKACLGRIPWNKGKTGVYTTEQINKMKNSATGRKLSLETKSKISKSSKGRIPWNKGLGNGVYIKKGTQKGFIWITKNDTSASKRVDRKVLDMYIKNGWHLGRDNMKNRPSPNKGNSFTEEQRERLSNSLKKTFANIPSERFATLKDKIAVNDGVKRIYINKNELDLFLSLGYNLGYPKKKGEI